MLKTYRIIPLAFILFLFGFTLITVAPAFAWDPSMGMRHPDRPCMKNAREKGPRFGCGPDMRSPEQIESDPYDTNNPVSLAAGGETVADSPVPSSPSPSGGEVAELNAKISGLEAGLTELKGVVMALQEQSKNSMQPVAPTAPDVPLDTAGTNHHHRHMEAKIKCLELRTAGVRSKPEYCFRGYTHYQDSLFDGL